MVYPIEVVTMYIDPGSGTLLWQTLLSGFFGILFFFRHTFRQYFSRKTSSDKGKPDNI
jgi:hypothetical protein